MSLINSAIAIDGLSVLRSHASAKARDRTSPGFRANLCGTITLNDLALFWFRAVLTHFHAFVSATILHAVIHAGRIKYAELSAG